MTQELVVEAGRAERLYWRDLWRYRELFYFLAWRDILVRYKQTVVGVLWAVIRPLLTTLLLVFAFGKIAGLAAESPHPYAILVFAAQLPWLFFATSLTEAGNSLIGNSNLVSKVYFPRLIMPASMVVVGLVDFAVSLALLAGLMVWYGYMPDWRILTLPVFTALAFLAAIGPGLWFCALNVKYRDFRYIVPFVVQFGIYVSPVGYSTDRVPERWRTLYSLNPMVGVIDGFRWAILRGESPIHWQGFAASFGFALVLLAGGVWFFRRTERTFADFI